MKKFISIILALVMMTAKVYAGQLNKELSTGLFADDADRLVCVELNEKIRILPDFFKMPKLEKITVHENNKYYKSVDGVLYSKDGKTLICYPSKKDDERFVCPDGVENIMSGAFYKNDSLINVVLPESLSEIGANPFSKCKNLKAIDVSGKNSYLSCVDGVLYDKEKNRLIACPGAASKVKIPDTVTEIGYGAFSGCTRLHEINLPEKLTVLESMAFNGCIGIKKIVIPGGVEKFNASCFKGCKNLENIIAENSEYCKSVDGIVYSSDMYELIYCPEGKSGEIILPQGVGYILNGAFDNCEKITRIIMPESMKNIARAFYRCTSLKNIEIPKNQAIIEYGTFEGCTSLEWVYLPNNVVIIQGNAIPETTHIICDEDSFAGFYAEANEMTFGFKYDVRIADETIKYSNQPFEKKGDIYLYVGETIAALGGKWTQDRERAEQYAVLDDMTVYFDMTGAECIISNQSEFTELKNIIYRNNDIYLEAEEFSALFGIECEIQGNNITLLKKQK